MQLDAMEDEGGRYSESMSNGVFYIAGAIVLLVFYFM